jgi:hypothetical protein
MMFTNEMRLVFLDSVIATFVVFYICMVCSKVYGFFKKIFSSRAINRRGFLDKYKSVSKWVFPYK